MSVSYSEDLGEGHTRGMGGGAREIFQLKKHPVY